MVEYYPKNNVYPALVVFFAGAAFILANEILLYFVGVSVPRFIAIQLVFIVGAVLLTKMNSKKKYKNQCFYKSLVCDREKPRLFSNFWLIIFLGHFSMLYGHDSRSHSSSVRHKNLRTIFFDIFCFKKSKGVL
jgi:hypothetical protein